MSNRTVRYPRATKRRVESDGTICVRYHNTDVVTIDPNGVITLQSGGWYTNTTKHRMNQYAPDVYVFQKRGNWFVDWMGKTYDFADGMRLNPNGEVFAPVNGWSGVSKICKPVK